MLHQAVKHEAGLKFTVSSILTLAEKFLKIILKGTLVCVCVSPFFAIHPIVVELGLTTTNVNLMMALEEESGDHLVIGIHHLSTTSAEIYFEG